MPGPRGQAGALGPKGERVSIIIIIIIIDCPPHTKCLKRDIGKHVCTDFQSSWAHLFLTCVRLTYSDPIGSTEIYEAPHVNRCACYFRRK